MFGQLHLYCLYITIQKTVRVLIKLIDEKITRIFFTKQEKMRTCTMCLEEGVYRTKKCTHKCNHEIHFNINTSNYANAIMCVASLTVLSLISLVQYIAAFSHNPNYKYE